MANPLSRTFLLSLAFLDQNQAEFVLTRPLLSLESPDRVWHVRVKYLLWPPTRTCEQKANVSPHMYFGWQ